jgi:hypothetical protein
MGLNIQRVGQVVVLGLSAALYGGCTTPGIVRIADDTYRVSRADPGHVFADDAAMKAAAVADADAFARGRGMVAMPVSVVAETLAVGHLKTLDYEFRLVPASAPVTVAAPSATPTPTPTPTLPPVAAAAVRPPVPAAPVIAASPPPPAPPSPPAVRRDYVEELIRLDDLRKRGILTEDEFQTLKAKIISER